MSWWTRYRLRSTDESKLDDEIALLRTEINLRDMEPRFQTLTAFDRFSVRV